MTPTKKPVVSAPKKPRKKAEPKPTVVATKPQSVIEAVKVEIAALPESLKGSTLALTALHLAEVLTSTSAARDAATLAKELRATLEDLAKAVGNAVDKTDAVDEIKKQREKRKLKVGM